MILDVTEDEAAELLATMDPLGAMAQIDSDKFASLADMIDTTEGSVQDLLNAMVDGNMVPLTLAEMSTTSKGGGGSGAGALLDRFVVPPFSVLDARQGYWRSRRQTWWDMGIQGAEGRDAQAFNDDKWSNQGGKDIPATSVVDPVVAELAYRWFCPPGGHVVSPMAGESVYGMVAGILGHPFTGVELRLEQVEANRAQVGGWPQEAQIPQWIEADAKDMVELRDEMSLAPADFLMSCPPYFDLEVYGEDPMDLSAMPTYAKFKAAYRAIVKASLEVLKDDRFACFVVGDIRDQAGIYRGFVSDTIRAFQDAGAQLYNQAVLVNELGSLRLRVTRQFTNSRKLGKTHQDVLIFVKGDPAKAVKACGDIDVAMPDEVSDDPA